ncbi:MAG TPA: type II 3-dehydroquinate dehydratase [Balneolales bacterium]|nr:type II 3-dehydroquinate dehydratase [Balneolales bacterium]
MNLLVINGPNLNMLGKREPEKYGNKTLGSLEELLKETYPDYHFTFFQSNREGDIIEKIHTLVNESDFDGVIGNFAGFTHTSVAIRDALHMLKIPKIEVHITNIHAREEFRHTSLTAGACDGVIAGLGFNSYVLAVKAIEFKTAETKSTH